MKANELSTKPKENDMKITYTERGGVLLPDLATAPAESVGCGKYGLLRKAFLREHRPGLYNALILRGALARELAETDSLARERVDMLVKQMAHREGVTEQLKVRDQMGWVGAMNNIKNRAEEIVLREVVYR